MSRSPVTLRAASAADAPALVALWADVAAPGRAGRAAGRRRGRHRRARRRRPTSGSWSPSIDGQVAGARAPRARPPSRPLNLEPVVQVVSPHVLPRVPPPRASAAALMEAAVAFAEELRHRRTSARPRRRLPATPTASWPGSALGPGACCGSRRRRSLRAGWPRSHRPSARARPPRSAGRSPRGARSAAGQRRRQPEAERQSAEVRRPARPASGRR